MHTPWRNSEFVRNGILASLSLSDFEYIRPLLESVTLKNRLVLQEPNRQIEYVHFVETGLISLMTVSSGSILETAMVGSQGVDPASVALGAGTSSHRSMVAVPGSAFRIRADDLRQAMYARPEIREQLLRYVHSLMIQSSQTALCGLQHHLEQRLACWLCLVCAAIDDNVLPITHSHLSTILGFHRVAVTVALTQFERQGLVRKTRGMLQIHDRELLERKACCCYGIVAKTYKRKAQSQPILESQIRVVVDHDECAATRSIR